MEQMLKKIAKNAKIWKIVLVLILAAFILTIILETALDMKELAGVYVLLIIAIFVFGFFYLFKYFNFKRCMKWLTEKNYLGIYNDINLEKPTLPKSKVYCGSKALFFKKSSTIIPYSEIAWVYYYQASAYGIPVVKYMYIFTRDGKKFPVKTNVVEFQWLLDNYLLKLYPDIMVGYSPEIQKRYKELYCNKQ